MQASCEHHLAIIDEVRGNYPLAEMRLARALILWNEAGPRFRPSFVMSSLNLGEVFREQGRLEDAGRYLRDGADAARKVRSEYPQLYPEALSRIGELYAESGVPELGRPLLVEAIAALRQLEPGQNAEEARAMNTLGVIDLLADHRLDAQLHLEQAVELSLIGSGPDHPVTAGYRSDLAIVFLQNRQYDRAEPLLRRALQSGALPDNLRLATILAELSVLECGRNKLALAEEYGDQAAAALAARPWLNTAASLLAQATLGAAWLQQHRAEQAERILPQTVAAERSVAPGTFLLADGLHQLAALRRTALPGRSRRPVQRSYRHIREPIGC
jgi:tetratricopeptide (TPR) repeat protein